MGHMNKIIAELYLNDPSDRDYFISTFNQYDAKTKQDFASLFFEKSNGDINIAGISVFSDESKKFTATITADTIFIKEKDSEKITSITPDDFNTIIGLRFINTRDSNTYFFFIDENYKMGGYDMQKQTLLTPQQQKTSSKAIENSDSHPCFM